MTDQDELQNLLGNNKTFRNRPDAKPRRKGQRRAAAIAANATSKPVAEKPTMVAEAEPMLTIHTENGSVDVPFNKEFIGKIFDQPQEEPATETEQPQTTPPEEETKMTAFTFPEVSKTFGNINSDRTWKQILNYVKGQVIGHPGDISEPFRALPRLLDTERDVSLRAYNFIDLVRYLGNKIFMADLAIEEGKTVLTFGMAKEVTTVSVFETDDGVSFMFDFDENTVLGKILSQKVKSGHEMPEIALDTALVVLDVAVNMFYGKFFSDDAVIELIRQEVAEMVS